MTFLTVWVETKTKYNILRLKNIKIKKTAYNWRFFSSDFMFLGLSFQGLSFQGLAFEGVVGATLSPPQHLCYCE